MRKPIRPFVVEVKGSKRASKLDDFWKLADQPAAVPADKALQTANSLFKKAPEPQRALAAAETHAGRPGAPARSGRILMDLAYTPPTEPDPIEAAAPIAEDPPMKRRPGRPRKVVSEQPAVPAARPVAPAPARPRAVRAESPSGRSAAPKPSEAPAPRAESRRPVAKTMASWMLEPDDPAPAVVKPVPPAAEETAEQGRARRTPAPSRAEKWKRRLPKVLR